jgi:hypothetical protein
MWGKADLEQDVHWGMPSYNAADTVCGNCGANRTDRPFTDLRPDAAWRPGEDMPNPDFIDMCHGSHPLKQSPYWT